MRKLMAAASMTLVVAMGVGAIFAADDTPAKPDQQAALDAFAGHTVQQKAVVDAEGNVTRLAISNHTGFWKDKSRPAPPPMPAAVFREQIVKLPHLQAIGIEKQDLGDADYALLKGMPGLRDVRLHYLNAKAGATRDAPLFINDLPLPLEVLEIKHCFSISGGCMERLKPQPELKKLEIDTGFAGSEAVAFIEKSKKLTNLQMHRTTMSDADLQRVFAALPELQVLLIRPNGQKGRDDRITGRSLRGLANCRQLEMVVIAMQWGDLPWEDGLAVLAGLPNLKQVDLAPNDIDGFSLEHPAVRKLHEARPDILIRWRGGTRDTLGGEGRTPVKEDDGWDWDGGVTTHG